MKIILLMWLLGGATLCQTKLEFEVASVKPSALLPGEPIDPTQLGMTVTPASISWKNATLRSIVAKAFRVIDVQIVGPELLKETFTVMATFPLGTRRDQIPEMLQSFLQKRFDLQMHKEVRTVTAGELTLEKPDVLSKYLAKGAVSRRPPKDIGDAPLLMVVPLSSLTRLSDMIRMPVLADRLPESEGEYIFWLDSSEGPSSIASSIQKYGIRLNFGKHDVEYVVVDRLRKTPTDN